MPDTDRTAVPAVEPKPRVAHYEGGGLVITLPVTPRLAQKAAERLRARGYEQNVTEQPQ